MKDIYTKPQIKLIDLSTEDILNGDSGEKNPGLDVDNGNE